MRTIALHLQLVIATALAAAHGATDLAAYSIALQVWMFGAYVSDGLEVAGHTLVGGELGRGDPSEARRVASRILAWSVRLGLLIGAVVVATRTLVPHVFTGDTHVLAATAVALVWVAALQPVNALAFSLDGILVGAGDQRYLAGSMIAALATFGAVAVVADRAIDGLAAVFVAVAAFMVVRAVAGLVRVRGDRWLRVGAVPA